MNRDLLREHYLVIKNFISPERAKKCADEFCQFQEENKFGQDDMVQNAYSWSNHTSQLELLCEFTPRISEIVGQTVLPTYTFGRIYLKNSELIRHADRIACEISITLHLEGDKDWPIWIRTSYGENHGVVLKPGDAMIYLGCLADHWRNPYEGEKYVQFFMHYVRSRGYGRPAVFDEKQLDIDECELANILKKEYHELR